MFRDQRICIETLPEVCLIKSSDRLGLRLLNTKKQMDGLLGSGDYDDKEQLMSDKSVQIWVLSILTLVALSFVALIIWVILSGGGMDTVTVTT